MKKTFFCLILWMGVGAVYAQSNEFYAGYGIGSAHGVARNVGYELENLTSNIFDALLGQIEIESTTPAPDFQIRGPLIVGYKRHFGKSDFGFHVSYTCYRHTETFENNRKEHTDGAIGFAQLRYDINYINKPAFQMYFGVSGGAGYESNTDDEEYLWGGFHLHLLGMRFGNHLGVFTEVGLGMNGLANAGVSLRF